jgi:hypothetical protein
MAAYLCVHACRFRHSERVTTLRSGITREYQYLNNIMSVVHIQEMLREHKTVFWIDSSIRFNGKLDSNRRQVLQESRGVLLFDYTVHSVFAATHETMYKYIAMSKPAAVNVTMRGAGAFYMHCSKQVFMGSTIMYISIYICTNNFE